MQVNLSKFINKGDVVAVATSGGSDSMALLHYLHANSACCDFTVIALNVEHGIRGQNSVSDSQFVKDYCEKNSILCLSYSVDSLKKAKEDKLSVEQAARTLRYECFYHAIESGKCNKVATAHHSKDNIESVLFNLFRGSGAKGLVGIKGQVNSAIIRPFLAVEKDQINQYIAKNQIPFVVDETNSDDNYTRNYIRLNILPKIKEIFPDAEKSVLRFCEIASVEDQFLDEQAQKAVCICENQAHVSIPLHKALFSRAVIKCLKGLGVAKDWEKVHIDSCYSLIGNENGSSVNLLGNIVAVKEYDKITFYRKQEKSLAVIDFKLGKIQIEDKIFNFEKVDSDIDLKSGLFFDLDKVDKNAVIRYMQKGDIFTKFGGGTKDLNDYLCDKKIPLRMRNFMPLLAVGNKILFVIGLAISNDIKVDKTTKNIIKFTEEK